MVNRPLIRLDFLGGGGWHSLDCHDNKWFWTWSVWMCLGILVIVLSKLMHVLFSGVRGNMPHNAQWLLDWFCGSQQERIVQILEQLPVDFGYLLYIGDYTTQLYRNIRSNYEDPHEPIRSSWIVTSGFVSHCLINWWVQHHSQRSSGCSLYSPSKEWHTV